MFAFQKWMFYHPYLDATDRYNNCGCLFRPVSSGVHERAKREGASYSAYAGGT